MAECEPEQVNSISLNDKNKRQCHFLLSLVVYLIARWMNREKLLVFDATLGTVKQENSGKKLLIFF